jgi:hypothetical protein
MYLPSSQESNSQEGKPSPSQYYEVSNRAMASPAHQVSPVSPVSPRVPCPAGGVSIPRPKTGIVPN